MYIAQALALGFASGSCDMALMISVKKAEGRRVKTGYVLRQITIYLEQIALIMIEHAGFYDSLGAAFFISGSWGQFNSHQKLPWDKVLDNIQRASLNYE
jgi:hypothetical protein